MYKIFCELNLFNKLFSLVCILISLYFINNMIFIYILIGLIVLSAVLIKNYNVLLYIIVVIALCLFVNSYSYMFLIIKCLLFVLHFLNINFLINRRERGYLLNAFMYSGSKKARKILFNRTYHKKVEKYHKNKFDELVDKNGNKIKAGMNANLNYKVNSTMKDLYLLNKIRFYNYYRTKTNSIKLAWSNFDNTFILLNIIVVVISYLYKNL